MSAGAAPRSQEPPAERGSGRKATSSQLIDAAFAASADAVLIVDGEGRIVLSSEATSRLFGYEAGELVGAPIELLVPPESRDIHVTHRKRFVEEARARRMGSGLQLYGRTRDGREIPVDVSLTPIDLEGAHYSAAFVRDATDRVRSLRQAEAVSEIAELLLAGGSQDESLALVINRARAFSDASTAWLIMPSERSLVVVDADGEGSEAIIGAELSATESSAARVMAGSAIEILDLQTAGTVLPQAVSLELGSAVYVPLGSDESALGVLVVARHRDAPAFEEFDVNLIKVFAAATATVLRTGAARRDFEASRLVAQQEHIGARLLEGAIQQAFDVGLTLSSIRPLAPTVLGDRIDEATTALDELIRDIRSAVFHWINPGREAL